MAKRPDPAHQGGTPARHPKRNKPTGRAPRYGRLQDDRLAGYLAAAHCLVCKAVTQHLILRHQIECKRCLTVRRRRPDDPAPA